MTSARKLILLFVTVAFLLTDPDCAFASAFDDLRKQYPDLARLLTIVAPKAGLSKEQLDEAFDNISTWALESKSQQVRDSIDLLVDKGRLDFLEDMRELHSHQSGPPERG